ncbi:MAG: ParM/StbA family protein [Clostridium sp.]
MILGIDVGNYSLKINPNISIKSLLAREENILGSGIVLKYDEKKFIVGEGNFETELNKGSKENFLPLLYTGIALASEDVFNQVVCGLPINQYKSNKEALERMVAENRMKVVEMNGKLREIVISEFKVYPEGVGAYYSLNTNEDVIIVDIGGRTTDIAYISDRKHHTSSTVATGTLNIYKSIAEKLNGEYSLDLDLQMIDRIIERGSLKIDGKEIDLKFITDILKGNFIKIKQDLDFKFPARTEKIVLVGGGAKLFSKAFVKRYTNCTIADNSLYANAIGFQKVGESLWQ